MNAWTSEPWPPRQEIGHSISLQDYNRARECVNGCAGLTEQEIKEAISEWKQRHRA